MRATMAEDDAKQEPGAMVGWRRQRSASRRMAGSAQAERLVSQKMAGIQSRGSETAQNAPARMAVRSSSNCRADAHHEPDGDEG